jgi:hypothetical protein
MTYTPRRPASEQVRENRKETLGAIVVIVLFVAVAWAYVSSFNAFIDEVTEPVPSSSHVETEMLP